MHKSHLPRFPFRVPVVGVVLAVAMTVAPGAEAAPGDELGVDTRVSFMGPNGDTAYGAGGIDGVESSAIAHNPAAGEYLVVWVGNEDSGALVDEENEIYAQRMDAASGTLLGTRIRVSDMGPDADPSHRATYPAVAFNAAQNEYLIAWVGDDDTAPLVDEEYEVFVQRLDASGAEIGTNDQRISDMGPDGDALSGALYPAVAFNPAQGEYLIAWSGDNDTPALADTAYEVFVQRLDAGGAEVGTNDQRISTMGPEGDPSYDAGSLAVAFNSTQAEYLIAWSGDDGTAALADDEHEVFVQRLDAGGVEVGPDDQRISDMGPDGDSTYGAHDPAVAFNPAQGEYLIAWYGDDNTAPLVANEQEVFAQRLDASGVEIGTNDQRISDMGPDGDAGYDAWRATVAFNPTQGEYLIAWYGDDNTAPLVANEYEVFVQRLNATGVETGTNDQRISDMGPDGDTSYAVFQATVGFNATHGDYLITWTGDDNTEPLVDNEYETFAQRYDGGAAVPAVEFELCVATPPPTPFIDIADSFAAAQIACLYEAGIVAGTSTDHYSPANPVTREQMAVFLMGAYEAATGGPYTGPVPDEFTDIASSFARTRIRQLLGLGVTAGTAPGIYSPTAPVTREQMAVFIVSLYTAVTGNIPAAGANPFTDIAGSFATGQIQQLVGLGITSGTTPTTYSPIATVTRDQMAVFIVNLIEAAT